jgi:voltage-gated potassium channel
LLLLKEEAVEVFSGLQRAALFIGIVVTLGMIGYRVLEDYTWLEAFYMTAITLSTVGYREVHPLSPTGQVFTIFLLAAGLGVVFYTMVAVAQKVVEGEFQQFFGRRRMQRSIAALHDHYLVCGFGRIGEVLCRELRSKPVPFVVIESQPERVREAETADYLVLQGDATEEKTLLEAGIEKAKGLFAALTTDAGNVVVTLTAKELNPALVVVARAETERSERTLLRSGADKVISPYAIGGHRMAQAALRPAIVDIIDLATHYQSLELQLEEIAVPSFSPCKGRTLQDSGLWGQPGVMIVAIKQASGKMLFNPGPAAALAADDSLIALAEAPQLKELERRVQGEG